MSEHCELHQREFEAFCEECGGIDKPMCSICLCEHNREKHKSKNTHISVYIGKGLEEINSEIKKVQKHKDEVAKHSENASRIMSEQNDIKGKIDYALNKVKENIKKYNQEVSKKSTVLLKCYEQLAKEITRCEHKINENISDPQKIERNVEAMKKQQKYWKAYKEVKRALIEDATPDASKIIEHANSYQKLLDDYKLQLKEVDNFAEIDVEKYQKNKLENEKLITDNKKVTQENEENKRILYLLSYHRNYKRIIRKTRYSLSPIIRV
jgi:ElaB/YqjD/DUF883 family membrane-anchored ribosome-binding protein